MNEQNFSTLCFMVLMQNQEGFMGKAPSYISEKLVMFNCGYDAYGFLDRLNQQKVLMYLGMWKCELPEPIARYEEELYEMSKDITLPSKLTSD